MASSADRRRDIPMAVGPEYPVGPPLSVVRRSYDLQALIVSIELQPGSSSTFPGRFKLAASSFDARSPLVTIAIAMVRIAVLPALPLRLYHIRPSFAPAQSSDYRWPAGRRERLQAGRAGCCAGRGS